MSTETPKVNLAPVHYTDPKLAYLFHSSNPHHSFAVSEPEISNRIAFWHADHQPDSVNYSLHDTLGWTFEEYGKYVETGIPPFKFRQQSVIDALRERIRQDEKWGEQNHDPFTWLTILMEEVGELSQAALHTRYGGKAAAGLREEAVQVAAVALSFIECLDRGTWKWDEAKS
jgi:NTP pyrophosphatase (non-canonical NTP hydrolase)